MKNRNILFTSLLVIPLSSFANNSNDHKFIGISWASSSATEIVSGTEIKASGFGVGFNIEVPITPTLFAGFSLSNTNATYDIANTTNYIDGKISGSSIYIGMEKPIANNMAILSTLSHGSSSADLTLHKVSALDTKSSSSVSGISGSINVVIPSGKNRIYIGASKGLTGDYSDNKMSFGGSIRFNSSPTIFTELGYAFNSDSSAFGGTVGLKF